MQLVTHFSVALKLSLSLSFSSQEDHYLERKEQILPGTDNGNDAEVMSIFYSLLLLLLLMALMRMRMVPLFLAGETGDRLNEAVRLMVDGGSWMVDAGW